MRLSLFLLQSSFFCSGSRHWKLPESPSFDSVFHGNLFSSSALVSPLCSYIVTPGRSVCNSHFRRKCCLVLVQMGDSFRFDRLALPFSADVCYDKFVGQSFDCPFFVPSGERRKKESESPCSPGSGPVCRPGREKIFGSFPKKLACDPASYGIIAPKTEEKQERYPLCWY